VARRHAHLVRHPSEHGDDEQDDEWAVFDAEGVEDDRQTFDGALPTVSKLAGQCRDHLNSEKKDVQYCDR